MAWLICGSVPQENFTLDEGSWNLDDGMLFRWGAAEIPFPSAGAHRRLLRLPS